MKKVLLGSVILGSMLFTGCTGEGDVKIKASESVVVEKNFFSEDKKGEQVVDNIDIFIDNNKKGVTQNGFVSFKLPEGEHNIDLRIHNNEAKYYKILSKKIFVEDKSTTELIFDIKSEDYKIELNKERIDATKALLAKYNLVGTWLFEDKSGFFVVREDGSWAIERYMTKKDSETLNPDRYILDDGTGLKLKDTSNENNDSNINYPIIKDDCFYLSYKSINKSFKACKYQLK